MELWKSSNFFAKNTYQLSFCFDVFFFQKFTFCILDFALFFHFRSLISSFPQEIWPSKFFWWLPWSKGPHPGIFEYVHPKGTKIQNFVSEISAVPFGCTYLKKCVRTPLMMIFLQIKYCFTLWPINKDIYGFLLGVP